MRKNCFVTNLRVHLVVIVSLVLSLVRLRPGVIFSSENGESNLHHIDAAFVMDYNKENELCHYICSNDQP